jgi:hypothetical protein
VPNAHVEITRVRRYREGFLVESEELGIHAADSLSLVVPRAPLARGYSRG